MRKKKIRVYEVAYASGMFKNPGYGKSTTRIYSNKKLKEGQHIVVEHIDYGVFIATVLLEHTDEYKNLDELTELLEYRYVQDIDLSNYLAEVYKERRKEELKEVMEERFKAIDKEQKFAYYATLDEDFKQLYDEYKNL